MKFLDLFSGIGGFRSGLEATGHECVAYCEIDKFARQSYQLLYDTEGEIEFHDITQVTDGQWRSLRGAVELICGGFPCQSFSLAGKRRGFSDTRGTLFFYLAHAVEQIQPRLVFLENVKGLLSHDHGETFRVILRTLDELGYDIEWQVLNSKHFGVPQNRERVFIIGHSRSQRTRKIFPLENGLRAFDSKPLYKVGNTHPSGQGMTGNVYLTEGISPTLTTKCGDGPKIIQQVGNLEMTDSYGGNPQNGRVYDTQGLSPSLSTMRAAINNPRLSFLC